MVNTGTFVTGGFKPAFGQTITSTTTSVPSGGFNFGTTSTPSGGFNLGMPAASSAGFGVGATSAPSAGFSFVTTSAPSAGFTLGSTTTSAAGASTGLLGVAPTATPSTTGFNFGTTTTTLGGAGSGGFSFVGPSTTVSTTTSAGTLFLSGGTPAVSSAPSVGLGGSLPSSTAVVSLGLGGLQPPTALGSDESGLKPDGKTTKETPLPQDIFATIELFENHKNVEKAASEANIRQTAAPFHKLGDDTKKLRQHVLQLSNKLSQLQASANKLKAQVMQEAENVEMSRRTHATPMSLQGENKTPEQYFLRLVKSFEERMSYCRAKIEEVEQCNRAANGHLATSPDDIKEVLRLEHDTMKVSAARVYSLHNQLAEVCHRINNNNIVQNPEPFFRPREQNPSESTIPQPSDILRPCLGDGGSGLLNFQAGQQRAKAVSLGAAPPTLPLGLTSQPSILGSGTQTGLFGSNTTFGGLNTSIASTTPSFGFGTNFSTGTNAPFATGSGITPGIFGPSFPNTKPFGESEDEIRRKRRI